MEKIEQEIEYVTVSQLTKIYPAFSEGSIRWLIYKKKENGFDKVIRKIGKRKIILKLKEFEEFLKKREK